MPETETPSGGQAEFRRDVENVCATLRKAFVRATEAITPPEEACKHFRQARVEVWKGIRELVDLRIAHLSREETKGTRVTVE